MFNLEKKKDALNKLAEVQKEYKHVFTQIQPLVLELYDARKKAMKQIVTVANELKRNSGNEEYKKIIVDSMASIRLFSEAVQAENCEAEMDNSTSRQMAEAVGGVIGGIMIATFGPSVAIAVATTFGTAATGVAISGLTGVAATNAALAWLGGGAIAAGGGGMAAGATVLSMLGPIGWVVGGAAAGLAGLSAYKKNQKVADEATKASEKLKKDISRIVKLKKKIKDVIKEINEDCLALKMYKEKNIADNALIIMRLCLKINRKFTI